MRQEREQRRDRIGAEAAQCVLRRRAHPPPLVGQQANERRRGLGPDDVACGACGMHADEPLAVVQPGEQRSPDGGPRAGAERLDDGGADVRVGVPRELDQRRVGEPGVRSEQGGAPEANHGIPVPQERDEAEPRGGRERLELGRDSRAGAVAAPQCVDEDVDCPVVAHVSERPDRSGRDTRILVVENDPDELGNGRMMGALEPLQCGDATPSPPLGARPCANTADESGGARGAERGGVRATQPPVVPDAPEDDDQ